MKLIYPGYMNQESLNFFGCKLEMEQREGLGVVGHFVKLYDGSTCMPSKNDIFEKDTLGNITFVGRHFPKILITSIK